MTKCFTRKDNGQVVCDKSTGMKGKFKKAPVKKTKTTKKAPVEKAPVKNKKTKIEIDAANAVLLFRHINSTIYKKEGVTLIKRARDNNVYYGQQITKSKLTNFLNLIAKYARDKELIANAVKIYPNLKPYFTKKAPVKKTTEKAPVEKTTEYYFKKYSDLWYKTVPDRYVNLKKFLVFEKKFMIPTKIKHDKSKELYAKLQKYRIDREKKTNKNYEKINVLNDESIKIYDNDLKYINQKIYKKEGLLILRDLKNDLSRIMSNISATPADYIKILPKVKSAIKLYKK